MKLKYLASALAFLLTLTFAPYTHAQGDIFGVLSGRVTDSMGALIPGVNVTIQNEATKLTRVVVSDSTGFFTAPEMAVGRYTVKGEKQGFKTTALTGIDLNAGAHATADLVLQVGAIKEEVTVESSGQTLNTQTAEMSATVDAQQVQDLALNERNYVQLTTIIAGAAVTTFDQSSFTTGMSTAAAAINGMREDQNLFTVDGGYNNDSGSNGTQLNNVGIDFTAEVSVQASNFSAEYGRNAAASVNVVTKSGGSQFHGGGFDFVRNDFFDATSPTNKLTYTSNNKSLRPPLRYNDYGWDVGGPIIKNKLFFFGGEEWKRLFLANNPAQLTVPTAAEIGGNFSDLGAGIFLTVPSNASAACIAAAGTSSAALLAGVVHFTGNVIPAACITTDGAAIGKVYSAMSALTVNTPISTVASANNATFAVADPQRWREDIIRIDYHPAPQHALYLRYLHDNLNLVDAFGTFSPYSSSTAGLPTTPTTRIRPGYTYMLGHIWTINTHMINEAKANASWNKQRIPPEGNTWQRSAYGFQFPLPFAVAPATETYPTGIPYVTYSNTVTTCPATNPNCGYDFKTTNGGGVTTSLANYATATPAPFTGPAFSLMAPTTDLTVTDTLTWERGHHTFKFGGMFARNRKDQDSRPSNGLGQINFQQGSNSSNQTVAQDILSTGVPFADALMGNFQSFTQSSANPIGFFRFNNLSMFVVDNWKVNSKLSFELGLRFEYTVPTYSQQNNMVNFDPSTYTAANAPTIKIVGSSSYPVGGLQDIPNIPGVTTGYAIDGLVRPQPVPSDQIARVFGTATPSAAAQAFINAVPATAPRGFFQPEKLFAPRLGLSYSLNAKTVIRAGAGLFFDKPEGNIIFGQPGIVPFLQAASFTNGQLANPTGPGGATPTIFGMSSIDPNLRVSRTAQYSMSVQHEARFGTQLQAAYVGNVGRHLLRQPNINVPSFAAAQAAGSVNIDTIRPYLGFQNITQFTGDATSDYNGLQLTAEKRRGILTVTFNYTYSKVLSQISGEADNPDPECAFTCVMPDSTTVGWKKFYTGPTSFDRRHIATATYTLTDPLFKHQHNIQAYALGGWSLSGVTHDQSGQYLTETASGAIGTLSGGSSYSRRASLSSTPSTHAACPAGKVCWFDPGAYAAPNSTGSGLQGQFTVGNAPIGNILGPGYISTDVSVRKNFGLWRGANFMFQADAFNVENKANKNNPNTTAGGSSNGQVSSFNPPRQMQFGGKVTF